MMAASCCGKSDSGKDIVSKGHHCVCNEKPEYKDDDPKKDIEEKIDTAKTA